MINFLFIAIVTFLVVIILILFEEISNLKWKILDLKKEIKRAEEDIDELARCTKRLKNHIEKFEKGIVLWAEFVEKNIK